MVVEYLGLWVCEILVLAEKCAGVYISPNIYPNIAGAWLPDCFSAMWLFVPVGYSPLMGFLVILMLISLLGVSPLVVYYLLITGFIIYWVMLI